MSDGISLAVDFGTSNTVAVLRWSDGRVAPVLFDGSPLLPSAVCAEPSGRLLVGRDAQRAGRMYPEGFEPNPKRRIDDGEILLGDHPIALAEVIGAVLSRVMTEARATAGAPVSRVILTHPVAWAARRRAILLDAAARAGIDQPTLVAEPVAAAAYYAAAAGQLAAGACLLVYDFGAGTFDISLLRNGAPGLEVLATAGLPDNGGLDVDAALVSHLAASYADRDPAAWRRVDQPANPADHRIHQQLWDDVCAAKEMLSRTSQAQIHLPMLELDVPIGREQFERLARPVLDRTVSTTRALLQDADMPVQRLAGVLMVGGSSRIPLTATLLHRSLGIAPTLSDRPELIVAEGALLAGTTGTARAGEDDTLRAVVPPPANRAATELSPALEVSGNGPTPGFVVQPRPRRAGRAVRVALPLGLAAAVLAALAFSSAGQRVFASAFGGRGSASTGSANTSPVAPSPTTAGGDPTVLPSMTPTASAAPTTSASAQPTGNPNCSGVNNTPTQFPKAVKVLIQITIAGCNRAPSTKSTVRIRIDGSAYSVGVYNIDLLTPTGARVLMTLNYDGFQAGYPHTITYSLAGYPANGRWQLEFTNVGGGGSGVGTLGFWELAL